MAMLIGIIVMLLAAVSIAVPFFSSHTGKELEIEGNELAREKEHGSGAADGTGGQPAGGSGDESETKAGGGSGYDLGIGYGGSFDEFAHYEKEPVPGRPETPEPEWMDAEATDLQKTADELMESINSGEIDGILYDEKNEALGESSASFKPNASDQVENAPEDSGEDEPDLEADAEELGIPILKSKGYFEDEVICNADSQAEAQTIASQISGLLLSWDNGVAIIQISGSVDDLLKQLEQQGSSLELYRHYYF